MLYRVLLSLALALLTQSSFAQDPPAPETAGVDDESGCGHGKASEAAQTFCTDFDVANMAMRDTVVQNTKTKCQAFYETALRLQNAFCSYSMAAITFGASRSPPGTREGDPRVTPVDARVDSASVRTENRRTAAITKEHIAKITQLGQKLHRQYDDYVKAFAALGSAAERDLAHESLCDADQITSEVPGYLRSLLVSFTWASAQVTMSSMFKSVRANLAVLGNVKTEAENSAQLIEMRAIEMASLLQEKVSSAGPKDDTIVLPNSAAATNSMVTYLTQKFLQLKHLENLARAAPILGSGVLFLYQWKTGQKITTLDTAVMFLSALQPEAGMITGAMLAQYRYRQEVSQIYVKFSRDEIAGNAKVRINDLLRKWGKRTKQEQCVERADQEDACIAKGKPVPYDHSTSCARGPMDPQRTLGPEAWGGSATGTR